VSPTVRRREQWLWSFLSPRNITRVARLKRPPVHPVPMRVQIIFLTKCVPLCYRIGPIYLRRAIGISLCNSRRLGAAVIVNCHARRVTNPTVIQDGLSHLHAPLQTIRRGCIPATVPHSGRAMCCCDFERNQRRDGKSTRHSSKKTRAARQSSRTCTLRAMRLGLSESSKLKFLCAVLRSGSGYHATPPNGA
jgi:hypothetical protein